MGALESILCYVPSISRYVSVKPRGKSLLIVGQNGSGKTSFVRKLHESLKDFLGHGYTYKANYISGIRNAHASIRNYPEHMESHVGLLKIHRENYRKNRGDYLFKISGVEEFSKSLKEHVAVLKLFSATRQAEIKDVSGAGGVVKENARYYADFKYGEELEQHIVNLKVRAAVASLNSSDLSRFDEIESWLDKFEQDLKYLFEDDSLSLEFDADLLRYFISRDGMPRAKFQELSSGYSAIFSIIADLLMRCERHKIIPSELRGVVLIDEIDAHLHVSLQRKILPFLMRSFPAIQYVVTTHSPFVLSSVDDVLIYDLSSGKTAHDLSMYPVDSIIEGLLGVPAISKKLEEKIVQLDKLAASPAPDYLIFKGLIDSVSPYKLILDPESRMYFEKAKNKVLRLSGPKNEGVDDV
ncbi:ATP-binding protein [Pseudomonas shahriarae]|uniref:AAA family ATPase n=1 Tax=Pseudomonas shahriarae TaxID=2745512 RepID=UPI001648B83E|nr:ATP-binding protein [Pseudomonas shahriarae]QXH87755.1 ATP-binding protein [Pseudomonas shahriarae]